MDTKHHTSTAQNKGLSWQKTAPWLLLGVFLTVTLFAWLEERREHNVQSQARFDYETGRTESSLLDRLEAYKDILRFATGFLSASEEVSHDQWNLFISSLGQTHIFPTFPMMSYLEPEKEGGAFKATHTHSAPNKHNQHDISLEQETGFISALEQVRMTGKSILTAHVPQSLDLSRTSDIVLLAPVFKGDNQGVKGIIAAGLDSRNLVHEALKQLNPEIHLEIFAGEGIDPNKIIFDSDDELIAAANRGDTTYSRMSHFDAGGATWTILFMTTDRFDRATLQYHHLLFLIAGLGLSAAVWFSANLLASSRERAVSLAADMTHALQSSEERLHLITDSVPVLIAYIGTNQRYQFANREFERWFGVHPDDIVGKTVKDMVGGQSYANIVCHIDRVLKGEKVTFEDIVNTPSGEKRTIYATLVPHLSPDGDVIGYFALGENITERKAEELRHEELVEDLERSNAELEQFAYVASHDLQEPLRMVSSYMQLIQRKYKGSMDEEADEFINYAVEGAQRMRNMISDLLTYSRVGTRGKDFIPVNATHAAEMAVENLQSCIQELQAKVTIDPLPMVQADEPQLARLFQNLIGNAIKYRDLERVPEVHVSAICQDGTATFSIKDNGIGIAEEQHDRVFMIFQRLHNRELYTGTGIGLAICKKTVERHGGKIWITSEVGTGSTFHFTLATEDEEETSV